MKISRKQFISMSSGDPVLEFLKNNKNYAYTRDEIAKELKLDIEIVSSKLRNLKSTKKVSHKKPFWMARR